MGEFYKMDYDAWDEGTVELSLEEEAAYLRLCHQMYRRKGPVPNSMRLLCSIWRCHANRAKRLLFRLLESGKITLNDDEQFTNERALSELQNRASKSRNTPPQIPKRSDQIPTRSKDLSICPVEVIENVESKNTEERRGEKKRGEKKEAPIGAIPVAPAPAPPSKPPKRKIPIPIPDDFILTGPRAQEAIAARLDAAATFEAFRRWALHTAAVSANWDVRWVMWIAKQVEINAHAIETASEDGRRISHWGEDGLPRYGVNDG